MVHLLDNPLEHIKLIFWGHNDQAVRGGIRQHQHLVRIRPLLILQLLSIKLGHGRRQGSRLGVFQVINPGYTRTGLLVFQAKLGNDLLNCLNMFDSPAHHQRLGGRVSKNLGISRILSTPFESIQIHLLSQRL